jgi:hypothetical protein
MRYQRLNEILLNICMSLDGDSNRWWLFYLLVGEWLEEVKDPRIGGIPAQVRIPVTDRRAWLPQGLSVGMVGVNVNGSLSPLLENPRMLDLTDDCGRPVAPESGNPDWPIENVGRADVRIDGGNWWWGNGFNGGFNGVFNGFAWSSPALWPGQGGGKSIRGYYRFFKEKNYILLDSTCNYSEIIVEGATETFIPGVETWIQAGAKEAIRAWITWKPLEQKKAVNLGLTRAAEDARQEYLRAMRNLRSRTNQEPLAMLVSAVQSGIGQIQL